MSLKIKERISNIELKNYTTIKIGGPAKFFFLVDSPDQLRRILADFGPSCYILGNGSNLLVKDSGLDKPVIKLGKGFDYIRREKDYLEVGGATSLASLMHYCLKNNLAGLENLVGIPATMGGLLVVNASSCGVEISSRVLEICLMDILGNIQKLEKRDIVFAYRFSSIGERIVLWCRFNLKEQEGLKEKVKEIILKRLNSQDYSFPSCGCIFKNPKTHPAGFLIDSCGLKGLRKGGALVSLKHANFILNIGQAKYADVDYLIQKIKSEVYKKYSIILQEEIIRWN